MDRFKFRAYITTSYEDDDDNEKEVSFYLYNVYMSDEGDFIYIDREFLLDAIENYDEETQDKIEDVLQENSCTGDYEVICIERGFYESPEQCIGLKDKNEKPIYEGDIVKDINGHYGYIKWDRQELKYIILKRLGTGPYLTPCSLINSNEYEIVGNIHQNSELLNDNK